MWGWGIWLFDCRIINQNDEGLQVKNIIRQLM